MEHSEHAAQNFAQKFVEYFLLHVDAKLASKRPVSHGSRRGAASSSTSCQDSRHCTTTNQPMIASPFNSPSKVASRPPCRPAHGRDNGEQGASTQESSNTDQTQMMLVKRSSFLRRFSLRKGVRSSMRPLRHLFKQRSDETELADSATGGDDVSANGGRKADCEGEKERRKMKVKTMKLVVECRRDGVVRQLLDDKQSGQTKWEKCRLVLVRTGAGDLLEFYSPRHKV